MPIETKNGIKNKILERVENTAAFSKENSKVKDKRFTTDMIPNMYCEKELVEAFRKEAKEKKWLYTTLMNEILRERYGKGNKKMKMISFCNKKGGVGKTTICKNIALEWQKSLLLLKI